ncbi:MAG: HupE/UreJ family protein [Endozoicomonas sp.]
MRIRLFLLLFLVFMVKTVSAHPLAPTLWAMNEQSPGVFLVTWKSSLKPIPGLELTPVFPEKCQATSVPVGSREGTGSLLQWTMKCQPVLAINDSFSVSGLDSSPAGVLFRLRTLDGRSAHRMLNSAAPDYTIEEELSAWGVMKNYINTGIGHLLGGIDHVLFVIALTLLVGWNRRLFWTVTLFTLGHSVTLSLTALGYVRFPVSLVESIIALSIVMAAVEIVRRDRSSLFQRRPWLMSGGFGLLHGMGFAGALSEVGLPANDIPLALAAFNIGIELGQLAVICLFALAWKTLAKLRAQWPEYVRTLPAYALGTLAAFWFWQRTGIEPFLVTGF